MLSIWNVGSSIYRDLKVGFVDLSYVSWVKDV